MIRRNPCAIWVPVSVALAQLEYAWMHIKIIRASLAFLSRNGRAEHAEPWPSRCGVALWPAPAACCWHRFSLNISHYFSFNDGMQWKRNSEFWNVCLHASPGRAGPRRAGPGRSAFGQKVLQLFFSIFLTFSFVCLIYVWKIHDPTPSVFPQGNCCFCFSCNCCS